MSGFSRARVRSGWSVLTAGALAAAMLAFLPASAARAAGSQLTLAKSGDANVLVGAPIDYTLTAHNGSATPEYNLSLRDVLPVGVTYKPGSTSQPKGLGDPQIITIGTTPNTQQVLIWSNVSDLPAGADQAVSFQATADPTTYPVGGKVKNTANAYTETNARLIPRFDSSGTIAKNSDGSDPVASDPATFDTSITAVTIAKSEDSPEHELMRGVHDDTATYTLKVTNNSVHPTDGNTVVDYLPAGLEFLGCGGVDNGSASEYGGRTLGSTPAPGGTCDEPASVDTVQLAAGNAQGLAAGVYTKVTWNLPDLAANDTWTTHYRAGIPQRANAMWPAGTAPTAGSGKQGANLDNNTGPDTREQASAEGTEDGELGLTNLAQVTGSYTGPVAAAGDENVLDSSSVTVTAEDLAVQKSVSPGTFAQGGVATYTLHVETGEYADASGITITDVIPDGMCPLKAGSTDDCAADASAFTATNATVQSVTHNSADNTWTVVFAPFDQDAQKSLTISYKALMGADYTGHNGDPTVSGDAYTNTVSLVGSTTTLGTVDAPDGGNKTIADVRDGSSATITSDAPSLSKTIMKQATPYACDAAGAAYTDNTSTPAGDDTLTFRVGDRVCFDIRADFSGGNATKNPVVTDFLPDYVTYESGSASAVGANTVTVAGGAPTVDGGELTWTVGTPQSGDRFVAKGGVFEWRLSAIVTAEPGAAPKPDITANLAKLTWTDTSGKVGFLRDQVDFSIGATPPVGIAKTHTGSSTVIGGDVVPYTITVTNRGATADHDAIPMKNILVRDVLPTGVDCSAISADVPTASCSGTAPSVLEWTLAGPLAAGASTAINYKMTVPVDPRILTDYVNTTGVVSYTTDTNLGTTITHHPKNTDPHLTSCTVGGTPDCDVPQAQVNDKVTVKNTGLTKVQATGITDTNNNAGSQAVIGEGITYTVTATVPAHTTVYQGVVTDPMPTGIALLSAAATLDGGALPGDVSFVSSATGITLTLPTTYVNDTDADKVFAIAITARVTTDAGNVHNVTRTNTATFTRKSAGTGGTNLTAQTASTTATIVEPSPSLTKGHTPTGPVAGGQTITYTLKAANAAGRPTLYDAYVVDCVPAGLTDVTVTDTPAGTTADPTVPGDGSNGCATGATKLVWHLPSLVGGASATLTYTVVVDTAAVGGQVYTNNATLTGTDLNDHGDETTQPTERPYTAHDSNDLTIAGSTLAKSTSTPLRAVGQLAEFTVTATVPASVHYYDATIVDTLPAGLDAGQVTLTGTTCAYLDTTPCADTIAPTTLTPSGQQVGWLLGDLPVDAKTRTIALTYTVPVKDLAGLDAGDTLTNSALLGWDLTDETDPTGVGGTPDKTSGPATSTVTVTEPDVTIAKAVSDQTPEPGESFTYTVTATNANTADTSTAHHVLITDVVPAGVVVDADTISDGGSIAGADPVTGGGTITWTLASLAKGAGKALTYQATLSDPAPSALLTNTAAVTSYCSIAFTTSCTGEGGRTYDGPDATATVHAALPHVVVAKSVVGGDLAYLGTSKSFQITITSNGNSEAHHVRAVDVLPANWTYDTGSAKVSVLGGTATTVNPSVSGQTLTWADLGDLPTSGDTIVITYTATPDDPDAATDPGVGHTVNHTNTVSVTAQDAHGKTSDKDGNAYNGPDAAATVHIDSADLGIAKTSTGTPKAGSDYSWTLTVTNHGPDAAVGPITVTDPMPSQLTGITASGTGWTCSVATKTVTCTRADSLANGAAFPAITVTGHIPADLADGTTLSNTATVTGTTHDPTSSNDTSTKEVTPVFVADMKILKSLSGALVAGRDATYTLDVTNLGPSVHRGPLTVKDAIPAGTTFVSASGNDWSCTTPAVGATGTVSCSRSDEIPLGAVDQITVVVHVGAGQTGAVTNTATVTADDDGGTTDPDHANNTSPVTTPTTTSADLSIDKSRVTDADFVAGHAATYLMTVHNEGPSDAQAVKVTDTLPSYLTYQGFTSVEGDWTCSASGQDVTCSLSGAMPATPGDNTHDLAVKITVLVADDHRGTIVNSARVDSSTPDPVPGNNSDTDTLGTGDVNADLSIAKSHPAGNVVAGGADVTYTLKVTNQGSSKHLATDGDITVVDAMPTGMTCVSVTGGTCPTTQKGSYTYTGDLAVGASFTVTVVAHVAADAGPATLTNVATVSGPKDDNPTNDTASDDTTVIDEANLVLTKTVTGDDPVRAGEGTSFRLSVHNAGPSDADAVSVTDTLPAGMTLVSIGGAGWTCDTGTLTCTRPTLAAGDTKTVDVQVKVAAGVSDGTTLTNHAVTATTTTETDTTDNDDSASVDVIARADLQLTKKHVGDSTVIAGTDTSYTLDVHNAGPSDAQGPITITDTLPTSMGYLSATGGWTCSAAGQVVTCTQPGPLLAGADATTLTLLVHVDADADTTAAAVNSGHVESTTTDPAPANNDDQATVGVSRGTDLSIVKSHTGLGTIGGQVDFTLAVHNAGPSTARAVTVSDPLPTGLEYVSADGGTEWTCAYDDPSRTVTCDHVGVIAPDTDAADIHVVVTVHPAAYPGVTNVATVGTQTPDSDPGNNTAEDPLPVPSLADLSVVKKHAGDLVVGQQAHYTLTVHNDGPTEAAGTVSVTDRLPAGLTFVSGSGDGWTCRDAGGTVGCQRNGLADGATSTIDLVVTVGPEAYPAVTNVASVQAPDADPDPSNNTSTDPGPVTPTVHLGIAKSVAYQHGTAIGWDIVVTNDGPSATVQPLVVVDKLPAGLGYSSAKGADWSCADVARTVTCTRTAVLAAGATSRIRVVTTVQAGASGKVRNLATVDGGGSAGSQSASALVKDVRAGMADPDSSDPAGGDGALPNTGGPSWWIAPLGVLLVLAGGVLLLVRRRRTS